MAECRRVQLTTLSSNGPAFSERPASVRESPSGVLQDKVNCPGRPPDTETVRLVLTLFEPDTHSFPEFNYAQLIENKINQTEDEVHLNRFEQEEKREIDEVAAVAKRLEEKYGSSHKKKDRIQDLIDIGYGYDDEDSFIDNSEAYDEFVPSSITTKFGGFYVNSGMLQFRQASDAETDDLSTEDKSTRKRQLGGEKDKPKKQQCRTNVVNSNGDLKLRSETGPAEMKTKKKKAVRMLSVTSMLKKFQREKERQKMEKAKQTAAAVECGPTIPLLPADAAGGGGSGLTDPILSLIGSTNDHALIQAASTVDFDIDLDSLLESEGTLSPKSFPKTTTVLEMIQTKMDDPTPVNILPGAEAQDRNTMTCSPLKPHPEQMQLLSEPSFMPPHDCEPLPEGLPPGLEANIRKLVVAAKISEGESKLKFFNPGVNSILLDIELQCQEQGAQLRSKVYRYLSSFLPCSKDTLLKRVRKLLITHVKDGEESPSVENPMQKLKESIGRVMPEQIACFHENCQAYEQSKTLKTTEEQNMDEKSGRRGVPKKLFKWNKEIRECLGHVLKEKMDAYKDNGGQEAEECLKILLNNEIKPLWPKGWMQSRVLIRESRKLLGLSAVQVNKVKCLKKMSISGASKSSDGCKGLQGPPALSDLHSGTDNVLKDSDVSLCVFLGAALKQSGDKMEPSACSTAESEKPSVNPIAAPVSPLLDVLANQELVHEQPSTFSHEFLTALAKHKTFRNATSPPPAPQSSPVDFRGSGVSGCFTSAVAGWTRETHGCWPEADQY